MKNNALKKKTKAKNSITSLATQVDTLREVITSLGDNIRDKATDGEIELTPEHRALLLDFLSCSDSLSYDMQRYSSMLDELAKFIN